MYWSNRRESLSRAGSRATWLTVVVLGLRGAGCFLRLPEKVDMKDDICRVTFGAVVEAGRGWWRWRSWSACQERSGGQLMKATENKVIAR